MNQSCHGGKWEGWCGEVVEMWARRSRGYDDDPREERASVSALFSVSLCMFDIHVQRT
jgi:hypothetical protein